MPADAPAVLIAARSGRALAACARSAGYAPLVADLFGDLDTRALAAASECVPGSLAREFRPDALMSALGRLARGRDVVGIVLGAGFESTPKLLARIACEYKILGNAAEVVTRVKDPEWFATHCEKHDIAHPEITRSPSAAGPGWLRKLAGGSGGAHIVPVSRVGGRHRRAYYQRRARGRAISALFAADGISGRVLGLSRQWTDPTPRSPFRYGGAVRPADVSASQLHYIDRAVRAMTQAGRLSGLNSADFLVRDEALDMLEINPRPGATLDIFADGTGALFRYHLMGCAGTLSNENLSLPPASAAMIVYADSPVSIQPDFEWPGWTADRQAPGCDVAAGAPVCTVVADAADAVAAESQVRAKGVRILAMVAGRA